MCQQQPQSICLLAADWLGGAVENTTSYTAFNGAYMHYFWAFPDPDLDVQLATAAQLQSVMAEHTTVFYPYDNLCTDPDPGKLCRFAHSPGACCSMLHLSACTACTFNNMRCEKLMCRHVAAVQRLVTITVPTPCRRCAVAMIAYCFAHRHLHS